MSCHILFIMFISTAFVDIITGTDTVPLPNYTDSIIRLDEYGSVRYQAPPHFKNSTRILFWTPAYGEREHWKWWFDKTYLKDVCPDIACDFSYDKNQLNDSDAILFMTYSQNFDLKGDVWAQLPPHRLPHQRWVHVSLEPPDIRRENENLTHLNGLFNWTMNYRRDADVYAPFGRLIMNKLPVNQIAASMQRDYAANKTKMAAWLVSHCPTDGHREDYVKELQKYMGVDVFGRCGPLQCTPPQADACYRMVSAEYKFYLAFENILCRHYVTEKFFKALVMDAVPVVFGGADYASYAPPGSYINALDFPNPEALAAHLKFLNDHPVEYNRYFDWKRGYSARFVGSENYVCELCMKLLDPNQPAKSYGDLDEWWHGPSQCSGWSP